MPLVEKGMEPAHLLCSQIAIMIKLFISHSSKDDTFVRDLQQTLGLHDVDAWIDSRFLSSLSR